MDKNFVILSLVMDKTSSENFTDWLVKTLESQNLTITTLAQRAGVSKQVISKYINQPPENPDINILKGIARALKLPPDDIFRKAGLLPQKSEGDAQKEQLVYLFDLLTDQEKYIVMNYIQFLLNDPTRPASK